MINSTSSMAINNTSPLTINNNTSYTIHNTLFPTINNAPSLMISMAHPVVQQHTSGIVEPNHENEIISTTNAAPNEEEHLRPNTNQSADYQHQLDINNPDDEAEPIPAANVFSNSQEHLLPNTHQPINHLHSPGITDLYDHDDVDHEDENEDADEGSPDFYMSNHESEVEGEDEASESGSESEPELDFGPAQLTDDDDAVLLERLLEEKRDPLGAEFRDMAILINGKKRVPHGTIGMATAYLDQDTSGTYDPSEERRRIHSSKRSRSHSGRAANENRLKKVKAGNSKRSITPRSSSIHSASNATNSSSEEVSSSNFGSESEIPAPPKRKSRKSLNIEVHTSLEREGGLSLKNLKEGHSQRRGCKACLLRGNNDCSLMEDYNKYPCTACKDGSLDCELIVPPVLKKSCEQCKRNKITCPYKLTGGRGVDKCEACDEADEPCCAAPLDENSAYGKRFTDTTATFVTAPSPAVSTAPPAWERKYTTCQQCRDAQPQITCSLRNKSDNGPCKCCKMIGQDCLFVLPTPNQIKQMEQTAATAVGEAKISGQVKKLSSKGKMTAMEKKHQMDPFKKGKRAKEVTSKGKTRGSKKQQGLPAKSEKLANSKRNRHGSLLAPELKMDSTDGIRHKSIETAFSHPIIFNYEPLGDNREPCSWCTSSLFGIFGHGEVTVEVIPYGGTRGNVEIGQGHCKNGKDQSKMCVSCTMGRVRITTCKSHEIAPIPNNDTHKFSATEYNDSTQALKAGDEKGGSLAKATKWCSICTSLADFSCCRPNPFPDPEFAGCGLSLCKVCHWTLGRIEKGLGKNTSFNVMDQLVKLRKKELYKWEGDEVRADSEFLRSDGEMMSRLRDGL